MSKFKVGDKVRILDGSNIKDYSGGWDVYMNNYIGEVHTVTQVDNNGSVFIDNDEYSYIWDERGLELVTEDNSPKCKSIIITQDDIIDASAKAMAFMTRNNPMNGLLSDKFATMLALIIKILFDKEREDK